MTEIRGGKEEKRTWFGGARVIEGGRVRSRSLGQIGVQVVPGQEESYSEDFGVASGPIMGDLALASLGPTRAERAIQEARARAARADAALERLGIKPRRGL